jgi:hypothetical protein
MRKYVINYNHISQLSLRIEINNSYLQLNKN